MDVDNSGALSKEEIKAACSCLGLKAWDIDEFFVGLEVNSDGEIELSEFKSNLPKFVFDAMASKLSKDGLIEGFTKK
jgi:Ca2+-binding EF-hand superfamily protein